MVKGWVGFISRLDVVVTRIFPPMQGIKLRLSSPQPVISLTYLKWLMTHTPAQTHARGLKSYVVTGSDPKILTNN
jgi:hypothetical protein